MRRLFLILVFVFLVINISASCDETQININSASAKELDNLTGVGNVTATKIIASRPFSSVDDLLNVSGIGSAKLEKIKEQGLACVNEEEQKTIIDNSVDEISYEKIGSINITNDTSETELSPIILNSKSIKSEINIPELEKNLAFGGIVIFCIVFGALFLLKNRKRKNEFQ
jgi:competence ComEA-like helix-hairpin-helix protein